MSEISSDMDAKAETNIGPDLFQYYICGVTKLLSHDDFLTPSSTTSKDKEAAKDDSTCSESNCPVGFGSLFYNVAGDGLSDFEKTSLKAMLRQSVIALTQEVDEMMDPVFSMCRLRGVIAPTKSRASFQNENCKNETGNRVQKRLKVPSSSSSINDPLNIRPISCTLTGEGSQNEQKCMEIPSKPLAGYCNSEHAKFSTQNTNPRESKSPRVNYSKQADKSPHNKDVNESFLGSSSRGDEENGEVNNDLQVLLLNRGPLVEEKMEKYSAELYATLGRMEEKLEELLDIVISSCRPMTLAEKHQLRGMIQNLPPRNLNRVVEIIQRKKPSEMQSCCDISINLEHEDDLTIWRIYFYVTAAENARKLLM